MCEFKKIPSKQFSLKQHDDESCVGIVTLFPQNLFVIHAVAVLHLKIILLQHVHLKNFGKPLTVFSTRYYIDEGSAHLPSSKNTEEFYREKEDDGVNIPKCPL